MPDRTTNINLRQMGRDLGGINLITFGFPLNFPQNGRMLTMQTNLSA
jgi:hypothetical protein